MTPDRKQMQRAINAFLVPKVRSLGFSGRFPHLRRQIDNEHHLLMIFFNKYGGSFYIDAGRISDDEFRDIREHWKKSGKELDESKLTVGHCNWRNRARLGQLGFIRDENHWYTYGPDNTCSSSRVEQPAKFYDKVALRAASQLCLHAEKFFSSTL